MDVVVDSVGYGMCTRAVLKNLVTFAEMGEPVGPCLSMERIHFSSLTRQPFRDAYFATSGLFLQKILEGVLWTGATLVRGLCCLDVTITWGMAKDGFIMAISNLAFLIISFLGMCRPKWGVSLWFTATKWAMESAGDDIVKNLANGLFLGFEELYPALVYNLGKEETLGTDETCQTLRENLKKVAEAIDGLNLLDDQGSVNTLKDGAIRVCATLVDRIKK